MKRQYINIIPAFLYLTIFCIVFSCGNDNISGNTNSRIADTVNTKKTKTVLHKPFATYKDTLIIDAASAVFYYPDSLQLKEIKKLTDSVVYTGSMHEYFSMMRNARIVIQKEWRSLKIIEAKNCRYLLFKKKDGSAECIDLDSCNYIYGLFVFDRKKPPGFIDMMNVDTQVSYYLNP
jgi:hypothetical protein